MNEVDTSGTDISEIPVGSYLNVKDEWETKNITILKKTGIIVTFVCDEYMVTTMGYDNFNNSWEILHDHGVVSDYTLKPLLERFKSMLR